MGRNRKVYDDDDGRSFADMDVDGMPWFARATHRSDPGPGNRDELSPRERRKALLGVFLAILAVTLIFGVAFLLVILLLDSARAIL